MIKRSDEVKAQPNGGAVDAALHPTANNGEYFGLEAKLRRAIYPLADGLFRVPTMYDMHLTVLQIFRSVYPIVGAARDFCGFAGPDIGEARFDARHSIPLVCLSQIEAHVSSESLLPEYVRTGIRSTAAMLRHRIDPTAPPPPCQKWKDTWLLAFDREVISLGLAYLAQWEPPRPLEEPALEEPADASDEMPPVPPRELKGKLPRQAKVVVSPEVVRFREHLFVEWAAAHRAEAKRTHWKPARGKSRPWTKEYFCAVSKRDRAEFGRWQRGELPADSATTIGIEQDLQDLQDLRLRC